MAVPLPAYPLAGLLPQGIQQFTDSNGVPLAGGKVYYYQSGTTVLANIWVDAYQLVPCNNPVPLDAAGRPQNGGQECEVYGDGQYSMLVVDAFGNTVWGPANTQDIVSALNAVLKNLFYVKADRGVSTVGGIPVYVDGTEQTLGDSGLLAVQLGYSVGLYADLRAKNKVSFNQNLVYVTGGLAVGDGGQGWFTRQPGIVNPTDNNGTLLVDSSGVAWQRQFMPGCIELKWFAVANGDFGPALSAAFGLLPAAGGVIHASAGSYGFVSAPTLTFPAGRFALALVGDGLEETIWSMAGTITGPQVVMNNAWHSIKVEGMTFATNGQAQAFGLQVTNNTQGGAFVQSTFRDLCFRGFDGPGGSDYWQAGMNILGLCNFTVDNCLFTGVQAHTVGLQVTGIATGAFKYSIVQNISKCGFFNTAIGIQYGSYVQGMTVSQCNFTNGTTGIHIPLNAQGATQLAVSDCQFQETLNNILIESPLATLQCTNNLMYCPTSGFCISFGANAPGSQHTISGNNFTAFDNTTTTAINCSALQSMTVTGNMFYGLAKGLDMHGSPSGSVIGNNNYPNTVLNVANPGTNVIAAVP